MKKMKNLKLFLVVAVLIGFTSAGFAEAVPKISKTQSLNNQIKDEIVSVLNLPVYISYSDKNLEGKATVYIQVNENGKINVAGITGVNKSLNSYLMKKISSRNLWTGTAYRGMIFKYEIKYVQSQ
jgi:hypothetical protein